MDPTGIQSNDIVEFLLERNYLLTAFELLHELLEDGQDAPASKLKQFFSDPERFPPDQLLEMQSLPALDTQMLFDEKEAALERAAVSEYELRLAREDLKSLQDRLEKQAEASSLCSTPTTPGVNFAEVPQLTRSLTLPGPARENERKDLNCAVKEYLVTSGYKVTAMTFLEEVDDQDIDKWQNEVAHVPDALRRYYHQFLSTTSDQVEKMGSLQNENAVLTAAKEMLENDKSSLTKQLEVLKKEVREKDKQVAQLKESLERAIEEANQYRVEVTSLKLDLDKSMSTKGADAVLNTNTVGSTQTEFEVQRTNDFAGSLPNVFGQQSFPESLVSAKGSEFDMNSNGNSNIEISSCLASEMVDSMCRQCTEKQVVELETVQILAEALPKIVPYVLINHREELLPLMMCAIERHPDSAVRDSLTHHLFNLIKRPDELQRRIIMDACVSLSKSLGEMRTETELLPQCWEQINHKYEERRLLVAQSCGELGQFVRPEMRASLILSIIQQLVEDSAAIVREAAAHNLALMLPLFSNMDKFFKVEELLFQLVSDPSGIVVEKTLKQLLPAMLMWIQYGKRPLLPLLHSLISHLLAYAERCPPVSGVEGSPEARLRTMGEKERWSVNVLLQMLSQLLPAIKNAALDSCPFRSTVEELSTAALPEDEENVIPDNVVKLYAESNAEWPLLDWMVEDCFPALLQLASMLPAREEILRTRLCKVFLSVERCFGACYHSTILVPIFLAAVGDTVETKHLSTKLASRVAVMKPSVPVEEQLAVMCVLPLLLAGVLSAPSVQHEVLQLYLKDMVLQSTIKYGAWRPSHSQDLIDAVRFLCTFKEQHGVLLNVLWELVVNASAAVKITATVITKALVGYADLKLVTQQILPALVTLASDPNVEVKHSSIEAFGSVAQHFKDEAVVEKIRVQMDAFLEDGSHEAIIAVFRTLTAALPLSASSLRDYLLQKLLVLSAAGTQVASLMRRHERADAFCEAIRALDAIDLSASSVKDLLLPTVSNLLKDPDALDPAHKEALEVILKERSVNRLESISKAMGMSTMGSIFGDGGFLSKKESGEDMPSPTTHQESGMLKRMMRNNYGGNIFSRSSGTPEQ